MILYVLDGHIPVPASREEWSAYFSTADRIVATTYFDATCVSTVFLGIDHAFGQGPPLVFETIAFDEHNQAQITRRCGSWDEAEQQHREVVEEVKHKKACDLAGET